jgi:hypothetical protein
MNIIEAINSGKRFKRKDWGDYYLARQEAFQREDVLADDWEVEPTPVTITREQFDAAWARTWAFDNRWAASNLTVADLLAKELGL